MLIPTLITKKTSKGKLSTFFTLSYNGEELGKLSIHNIVSNGGIQGVRVVWHERGRPFNPNDTGIVYEYTDKDEYGNIKLTK